MLHMHQSYQFSYRSGHIASTLITGTAALGDANLAPEIMLVKTKLSAYFPGLGDFFKEFHEQLSKVMLKGLLHIHNLICFLILCKW